MLIEEMLDSIVRTEEEGERLEQVAKAEAKAAKKSYKELERSMR